MSDEQEMGTILITGGGGYLGYHCALVLHATGHRVILYDIRPPQSMWQENSEKFCFQMSRLIQNLKNRGIEALEEENAFDSTDKTFPEFEEEAFIKHLKEMNRLKKEFKTTAKNLSGSGLVFVEGDIRNAEHLRLCLNVYEVSAVIHTVSYGMSGTENLPAYNDITEEINIQGSRNVLLACLQSSVKALVYTSTVNVVYNGTEIHNGSESTLKYLSLNEHTDHYSRTKQISEELILMANGKQNKFQKTFCSTALRLVGLYGPMEQRHLPRSIEAIKNGYMMALYSTETKQDMIHIVNAVQAHCKALKSLLSASNRHKVAGEAFFVTDGKPVNNVLYFLEGLLPALFEKPEIPTLRIPFFVLLLIGYLMNLFSIIFGKLFSLPSWALTVTEVYKTGVTHTFSIEKAKIRFGYDPIPISKTHWREIVDSYHLKKEKNDKNPK